MGFDAGYSDKLRDGIRRVITQAAGGLHAVVNLDQLRAVLYLPDNFHRCWKAFQCIENHDLLDANHTGNDLQPRIAALADSSNSRSWYARSRSRVATGLLLTAPGIPMMFMGQEFLEDKPWTDNPRAANLMIWWGGLGSDKTMSDHHRFTRDLIWLRRKHPALRGEAMNVFHVHNDNRVIAFHRWLPGLGRDVVMVASLNENTFYNHGYTLGFPGGGQWLEVFNSDIYDNFFNPNAQGNPGGVTASGPGIHGLPSSAGITLPANSILVFARDWGDPA
jgi:1,4-alpha-glucan branching enzyme